MNDTVFKKIRKIWFLITFEFILNNKLIVAQKKETNKQIKKTNKQNKTKEKKKKNLWILEIGLGEVEWLESCAWKHNEILMLLKFVEDWTSASVGTVQCHSLTLFLLGATWFPSLSASGKTALKALNKDKIYMSSVGYFCLWFSQNSNTHLEVMFFEYNFMLFVMLINHCFFFLCMNKLFFSFFSFFPPDNSIAGRLINSEKHVFSFFIYLF